jgi:hypothetical protein
LLVNLNNFNKINKYIRAVNLTDRFSSDALF